MRVYLLRHGRTAYNQEGRYQGQGDIPLSAAGEAALFPADFSPETVWVSPLERARRTAALLFPSARQVPVEAFQEMDFGAFEGRTYREMEDDPAYRAWVESGCEGRCPGGEDKASFCARVRGAFPPLVEQALEEGREELTILAHGGVQMALMEAFALPEQTYFHWQAPCAGGYLLECDGVLWRQRRKLRLVKTVDYGKGGGGC